MPSMYAADDVSFVGKFLTGAVTVILAVLGGWWGLLTARERSRQAKIETAPAAQDAAHSVFMDLLEQQRVVHREVVDALRAEFSDRISACDARHQEAIDEIRTNHLEIATLRGEVAELRKRLNSAGIRLDAPEHP